MAQTHLYSKVFVVLIHGITELEYTGAKKNYRGRSGPANESVRVTRIGICITGKWPTERGRASRPDAVGGTAAAAVWRRVKLDRRKQILDEPQHDPTGRAGKSCQ
jgi:hypothetical protein